MADSHHRILHTHGGRTNLSVYVGTIEWAWSASIAWVFPDATGNGIKRTIVFSEKLTGWQKAAVVCALLGVLNAVFRVGGMSWETLLVALGYPLYFTLRRRVGIGHMGMYWLELVMLTPLALYWLFNNWSALGVRMSVHHDLIWIAPVFGIISTAALQGYMYASKALTFSLFGLLSYVEPVLLAVAAMLLGEVIQAEEWPTYIFIWMAVCLLAVEGVLIVRRQRRMRISADNLLT